MPAHSCGCNSSTAALCDDLIEVKSSIDVRGLHYQVSRGYHSRIPAGFTSFFFSPPGCKNPATYSPAEVWSSAARSPGGWGQEAASGKRQSRGRLLSSQRFSTDLRNLEVPRGAPGYVHKTQPPPAPWRFTPAVKFSALVPWYRATAAEGSLYVNIWCSLVRL